ncbi:MAG: hypothetical protein K1X35_01090 [Caulobacteraceae bacterium]|nr:hypothetical protein [Caulobacteraceae bacterium]
MKVATLLAAAVLGLAGGVAMADDAAPATTVEGVTVVVPNKATLSEFIRDVTEESRDGRVARWNRTICPATAGLERRYAEYMNERLAAVARQVGLKVAKPGCRPDILIIVTPDVKAVLEEMERSHKEVFAERRWSDERTSAGGSQSFQAFLQSDKPVRWWHVSETVAADGQPVGDGVHMRASGSRLRDTVREDFAAVIVVVDARKAQGVSYQALSDYVAMVSLAQLNPNVNSSSASTVLNIFSDLESGRPTLTGLTDWDLRFLKSLYAMRADTPGRSQRGRIIGGMEEHGRND